MRDVQIYITTKLGMREVRASLGGYPGWCINRGSPEMHQQPEQCGLLVHLGGAPIHTQTGVSTKPRPDLSRTELGGAVYLHVPHFLRCAAPRRCAVRLHSPIVPCCWCRAAGAVPLCPVAVPSLCRTTPLRRVPTVTNGAVPLVPCRWCSAVVPHRCAAPLCPAAVPSLCRTTPLRRVPTVTNGAVPLVPCRWCSAAVPHSVPCRCAVAVPLSRMTTLTCDAVRLVPRRLAASSWRIAVPCRCAIDVPYRTAAPCDYFDLWSRGAGAAPLVQCRCAASPGEMRPLAALTLP
jgi:hypothetical protein